MNKTIPRVILHPASCKYLRLGHPWITEDSFTKRFPREPLLLLGIEEKSKKEIALLVNDPQHKSVKARLWSLEASDFKSSFDFIDSTAQRIFVAIKKRVEAKTFSERENIYLINAENDQLPGLLVQLLKDEVLLQYYAHFWKGLERELIQSITHSLKSLRPELVIKDFWIQERNFDQEKTIRSVAGKHASEFVLQEFGNNYRIRINQNYDFGIYSDMSAIRKAMLPFIKGKKSLLNLFSYTGAFSVFALSLGVNSVVSVDLSPKYLAWLEENLALNPGLNATFNHNLCMPCEKALDKLIAQERSFELIICDPPSASSDGQKMSSALKSYEALLPKMLSLLDLQGSLFVFLNTHTISWNKFEEKIKQIIEISPYRNQVVVGKRFKLAEDCVALKGFHEGDYLKGLCIEFKTKGKTS